MTLKRIKTQNNICHFISYMHTFYVFSSGRDFNWIESKSSFSVGNCWTAPEAKFKNLPLTVSHKKWIILSPLCSWNASPAALARDSAGARPSDATARPTQPVHPCSRQSDLNVDKSRRTVIKGAVIDTLNYPFIWFLHLFTHSFLQSFNTRIKRYYFEA